MLNRRYFYLVTFFVWALLGTACFPTLHSSVLPPALINQPYEAAVDADAYWSWNIGGSDMIIRFNDGNLPSGIIVDASGNIVGTPTEVGNFEFELEAIQVDRNWGSDDASSDWTWFTLFVTEDSTNEDCPSAGNSFIDDFYLCAGEIFADTLAQDDEVLLDINIFLPYNSSKEYDITTIEFTIHFDSNYFTVDDSAVNSTVLREAATRMGTQNTVFDNSTPGELTLSVTVREESFHVGGRFVDLPIRAVQNVPAGTYPISISFGNIIVGDDADRTATQYTVDGSITIDNDIAEEE